MDSIDELNRSIPRHTTHMHARARPPAQVLQGMGGASHSFAEEEKAAFAEHINAELADDPHLRHLLPIDPACPKALFRACSDGLVFWCVLRVVVVVGKGRGVSERSECILSGRPVVWVEVGRGGGLSLAYSHTCTLTRTCALAAS